jgi:DNA modification methylase
VEVFAEVRRVLRDDGTLWVNIADSYAGSGKGSAVDAENAAKYKQGTNRGMVGKSGVTKVSFGNCKNKDLVGVPWLLAFALRDAGYYLRQDIIWAKPNPMPEPVKDRCVKAHEYIFLFSKSRRYYFDHEAIQEPAKYAGDNRGARGDSRRGTKMNSMSGRTGEMRNKRDVWTVTTKPYKGAHFATFPVELITPCILAGCPEGGTVLDVFAGSGTTGAAAARHKRNYILIDINSEYIEIAKKRTADAELSQTFFDYKEVQ